MIVVDHIIQEVDQEIFIEDMIIEDIIIEIIKLYIILYCKKF